MADLLNLVKQAAVDAVKASNPVALMTGTVIKDSPLEVKVDQRFTLTAAFLILPQSMQRKEIIIDGTVYVISDGVQVNDNVLLLRVQGGQKYILLDRW
ncbi:hypothetical protein J40TS1_40240 [Paenibacillus montaniterrae]|uniref:DUF2577 domain-containing protein n=1 Tax=Paenibacillus montaniterrae TaxID=429341 RepID=A0A920CVP3_9BACL|nr:DUF2577 domain-containing protein [Paenibacillus montaniterrae]GIP18382.1 hypothetical protein J40TS1_40240 [Paenibacillus montaniterrae]